MDVVSYLLGKNSGGGSEINNQNKNVTITTNGSSTVSADAGYTGLGTVSITTNVSGGGGADLSDYFDTNIFSGGSTTSGVERMIKKIPDDTKISGTSANYMFANCTGITSIASQFDTSGVVNMKNMFSGCINLQTIPQLNTANVTNMQAMFQGCNSLSDTSLDNILQMCINATSYTGTKTLYQLGFDSTHQPASRIQALPHYQAFLDAGWTIGY